MRLTRVEIENFKGISTRQRIDLRPITLLFGPNSAGKSTILQALHYLREILERGNIDPDVTIAGGLVDLGGFATLVHNHDLDRTVRLKVVVDLIDGRGAEALQLNSGEFLTDPPFSQLQVRYIVGENPLYKDGYALVHEIGLAIDIEWSDLQQAPYVSRLGIELDGEPIAAIASPPQEGRAQLAEFNFAHPLLRRAERLGEEEEDQVEAVDASSPLADEIWSLAREAVAQRSAPNLPGDQLRIGVATRLGALPNLNRPLEVDLVEIETYLAVEDFVFGRSSPNQLDEVRRKRQEEFEFERRRRAGLTALLDELMLAPVRMVRDLLVGMTYIGPLREVPGRGYRAQITPDESRWANGLAAWDLLYSDRGGDLMEEVNRWLSDEGLLRTTYRLERVKFKEVPVPGAMHQMFERGLNEDDLGELQELYYSLATRTEIALRDFEKGILVAPGDVGVGISQMVPVVVAALREQDGVLGIEQPELHVHPAIQVGMGDLFIHAAARDADQLIAGKSLIIETHSEHIMLRLLRRIREATDDDLPPGVMGLSADDLSVIYVESGLEGVRFRPLRVDEHGEFRDQWPQGFFEERAGELF